MTPVTAMILTGAATIWWIAGLKAGNAGSTLHYAVGIAISALLVGLATSRQPVALSPDEDARRGKLVGVASAVEGVLILVSQRRSCRSARTCDRDNRRPAFRPVRTPLPCARVFCPGRRARGTRPR
jgi:hypothetical protein